MKAGDAGQVQTGPVALQESSSAWPAPPIDTVRAQWHG
jgi:hypothetical protein